MYDMTKKNSNRDVRESRPNGIKSFFVVKKNSFNEVDGSSVNVDTNSPSVILTKPFRKIILEIQLEPKM